MSTQSDPLPSIKYVELVTIRFVSLLLYHLETLFLVYLNFLKITRLFIAFIRKSVYVLGYYNVYADIK
ncbi:hypothetical protein AYJ08_06770 [Brevibacillus sp. SKDU10]|nr:hypothetical protein AYJ08_06770 [Brevibacillus sp. SKDU10]